MKVTLFVSFIISATACFSQPVRLHIMGGFANYNGDLQQKRFTLNQAKGVVSAGATFNITDQLSVRSDYSFAKLAADDKRSSKAGLRARNLNFNTNIYELTLLGEYDIFNLYKHKFSPYVFGGVGIFNFSPYTYGATGNKVYLIGLRTEGEGILKGRSEYKRTQFNVPIGGGIKYALSDDVHVGFELGLRVLKTDYLDDVSTTYVDQNTLLAARGQQAVDFAFRGDELKLNPQPYPKGGTLRGNGKVNDFYYFGLFRIDFAMNWFDKGGHSPRGLSCPGRL